MGRAVRGMREQGMLTPGCCGHRGCDRDTAVARLNPRALLSLGELATVKCSSQPAPGEGWTRGWPRVPLPFGVTTQH